MSSETMLIIMILCLFAMIINLSVWLSKHEKKENEKHNNDIQDICNSIKKGNKIDREIIEILKDLETRLTNLEKQRDGK